MDRIVLLAFGDIEIIGREADLPRIHHLTQRHAFAGLGEIGALAHEHGALSAQLERDRDEILGCRFHHTAAGGGRTGKDQMVEGQLAERRGDFGPTGEDRAFVGGEIFLDQFPGQQAGLLGEFARLDHRAIARRENLHQRAEAEIDGEIPRAEDANHALRLVTHLGLCPQQAQRELDMAFFRARPFVHMLETVLAEIHRARDVGDHRLVRRTIAEIGRHHLAQILGVVGEQFHRALDTILAQRHGFGAHLVMRGTLFAQHGFHFAFPIVRHCSLRLILLQRSTRLCATR